MIEVEPKPPDAPPPNPLSIAPLTTSRPKAKTKPKPTAPPSEKPTQEGGIECPDCGGTWHQTLETRRTLLGTIQRRRECCHCGRRFTTRETIFGKRTTTGSGHVANLKQSGKEKRDGDQRSR